MTPLLRIASALAVLLGLAGFALPARGGAQLPPGFVDELMAAGLSFPVAMAFLPDGRLVVTEKNSARIRLMVNEHLVAPPVAVMDSVRFLCDGYPCTESGLLGIAVDPGWPQKPYLYTMYNWSGGPYLRLVRLTASGDLDHSGDGSLTADPAGEYLILSDLPDDTSIHNGGTLRFAPDGMLFVSLGDDFTACLSPDTTALAGKLLRIAVDDLPPGAGSLSDYATITPPDNPFVGHADPRARLVWALGLRNPWGFHIDDPTGRVFVPDVGNLSFEEINVADVPGLQFGWPWYEADSTTTSNCFYGDSTGSRGPIFSYDRRQFLSYSAVMGAGVYRRPSGPAPFAFPPEYEGNFFFSDLGLGFMRRLVESNGEWTIAAPVPGQPSATDWGRRMHGVTDYAVGPEGALWYVKSAVLDMPGTGEIHRIHGPPESADVPRGPARASQLARPYPSPSRGTLTLGFSLSRPAPVRLEVLDLAGRSIRTLVSGARYPEGRHSLAWDGRDDRGTPVPTGVYVVTLATPEFFESGRCLIVR